MWMSRCGEEETAKRNRRKIKNRNKALRNCGLCFLHLLINTFFCPQAKQRNPYALNVTGESLEDQDGDSRYMFLEFRKDL